MNIKCMLDNKQYTNIALNDYLAKCFDNATNPVVSRVSIVYKIKILS